MEKKNKWIYSILILLAIIGLTFWNHPAMGYSILILIIIWIFYIISD